MISYFIGCNQWTPGTKHRYIKISSGVDIEKLKEMLNDGRMTVINVYLFKLLCYYYYCIIF